MDERSGSFENLVMTILGAGGHAKSVIAVAKVLKLEIDNLVVTNPTHSSAMGLEILDFATWVSQKTSLDSTFAHVAIGDNRTRRRLAEDLLRLQVNLPTLISPSSHVDESVKIGFGCVIMPGAVVRAGAILGNGVIINSGAVVDHDCQLASWVHVGPNSTLTGGVRLGQGVFWGAGAIALPNVCVSAESVIGAGSVVTKNLNVTGTYYGNPAFPVPARKSLGLEPL